MKILLLGASGQVGWQLRRSLGVVGEVIALDRSSQAHCADLSRLDALARTVRDIRPAVIVNAAAYTAVDKAESEPQLAFAINAHACEVLAREAATLGAWVVHYSTDYVFDGSGTRPWIETDPVAPLNTYGRSKLAGEVAVATHAPRHLILRTSWVFETWGANFLKTILRAAAQRESLDVVSDQWGAPTRAALIADATAHLIRQLDPEQAGIYHLQAAGETTWHGYACFAVQEALRLGMTLKVTPESIRPVATTHYPTPAMRPANSRLDTSRLRNVFGITVPGWQDGVSSVIRELSHIKT